MELNRNTIAAGVVALLLVVGGAFTLGKHVGVKRESWRAAVAARHAAVQHCLALGKEVNNRVVMAFRQQMPIAEFEKEFGALVPVGERKFPDAKADTTHVYTHEPSHRVFYLRFEDGRLLGYSSNHGVDDIQPYLPSIEE